VAGLDALSSKPESNHLKENTVDEEEDAIAWPLLLMIVKMGEETPSLLLTLCRPIHSADAPHLFTRNEAKQQSHRRAISISNTAPIAPIIGYASAVNLLP